MSNGNIGISYSIKDANDLYKVLITSGGYDEDAALKIIRKEYPTMSERYLKQVHYQRKEPKKEQTSKEKIFYKQPLEKIKSSYDIPVDYAEIIAKHPKYFDTTATEYRSLYKPEGKLSFGDREPYKKDDPSKQEYKTKESVKGFTPSPFYKRHTPQSEVKEEYQKNIPGTVKAVLDPFYKIKKSPYNVKISATGTIPEKINQVKAHFKEQGIDLSDQDAEKYLYKAGLFGKRSEQVEKKEETELQKYARGEKQYGLTPEIKKLGGALKTGGQEIKEFATGLPKALAGFSQGQSTGMGKALGYVGLALASYAMAKNVPKTWAGVMQGMTQKFQNDYKREEIERETTKKMYMDNISLWQKDPTKYDMDFDTGYLKIKPAWIERQMALEAAELKKKEREASGLGKLKQVPINPETEPDIYEAHIKAGYIDTGKVDDEGNNILIYTPRSREKILEKYTINDPVELGIFSDKSDDEVRKAYEKLLDIPEKGIIRDANNVISVSGYRKPLMSPTYIGGQVAPGEPLPPGAVPVPGTEGTIAKPVTKAEAFAEKLSQEALKEKVYALSNLEIALNENLGVNMTPAEKNNLKIKIKEIVSDPIVVDIYNNLMSKGQEINTKTALDPISYDEAEEMLLDAIPEDKLNEKNSAIFLGKVDELLYKLLEDGRITTVVAGVKKEKEPLLTQLKKNINDFYLKIVNYIKS